MIRASLEKLRLTMLMEAGVLSSKSLERFPQALPPIELVILSEAERRSPDADEPP
jgi:hypothetical protein